MNKLTSILTVLLIVMFAVSCKNSDRSSEVKTDTRFIDSVHPSVVHDVEKIDSATGLRAISPRDYSIDSSNSYSKFFFDSSKLEAFFKDNNIPDSNQRRIISFYNTRNYQFAWFSKSGVLEDTRGFWNLHNYYTTYKNDKVLTDSALIKVMDNYLSDNDLAKDTLFKASNAKLLNTELKLTNHFINYTLLNFDQGYVHKKEIEYMIPSKRVDPMQLADSLVKYFRSPDYYGDVSIAYNKLKDHLIKYVDIHNQGNLPALKVSLANLDSGKTNNDVSIVKHRMNILGIGNQSDTLGIADTNFINRIKAYQESISAKPTGKLTEAQLKTFSEPLENKIKKLLVNMNRARWMVNHPQGRYIYVNIPEFMLHVYEDSVKQFEQKVIVGKQGTSTTVFTGDLSNIVFSPYWNVPLSITKKEILPAMRRSRSYLTRNNMEVYGSWGDGIPRIRQKPGPKNALGQVKFIFPNSYEIYLHDSPQKYLFNQETRAYSHGCVRVQNPVKMATYLLEDTVKYSPAIVDSLMNLKKEKWIKIKDPVPVMIAYNTAWVDENGMLRFANDIYKKDTELANQWFIKPTKA